MVMDERVDAAERRLRLLQSRRNLITRGGRCILASKERCSNSLNTTLSAVEARECCARRRCHRRVTRQQNYNQSLSRLHQDLQVTYELPALATLFTAEIVLARPVTVASRSMLHWTSPI